VFTYARSAGGVTVIVLEGNGYGVRKRYPMLCQQGKREGGGGLGAAALASCVCVILLVCELTRVLGIQFRVTHIGKLRVWGPEGPETVNNGRSRVHLNVGLG
jgi:hypothetical protein